MTAANLRLISDVIFDRMKKIISRNQIKEILNKWLNNELSASQVHEWAGNLYPNDNVEYTDWEGDDDNSVTNQVLADLDMMDMNLMIKDDIEHYLVFLDTPPDQFNFGCQKLENYLYTIDLEIRREELRNDEFYSNFCG